MKWVRNRLTRQADFHHVTHPKRGSKFTDQTRAMREGASRWRKKGLRIQNDRTRPLPSEALIPFLPGWTDAHFPAFAVMGHNVPEL